jgi:hypothetical protein
MTIAFRRWFFIGFPCVAALLAIGATGSFAQTEIESPLPPRMEAPDLKQEVVPEADEDATDAGVEEPAEGEQADTLPPSAEAPLPSERPGLPTDTAKEPAADGGQPVEEASPPEPEPKPKVAAKPVRTEMPGEEVACRARLRELGVTFKEHAPLSEPEGCSAAHPITVSELPDGVKLEPEAVLTCAMAEATARFVKDEAGPILEKEFGSELATVNQVSSYVCRPRNGTNKLSEHAFANALDWGALELADGTQIDVQSYKRSEPRRTRIIQAIRDAACGPFKTVLGPGSDADHADHFHFDLAQRRNGGTFCQ